MAFRKFDNCFRKINDKLSDMTLQSYIRKLFIATITATSNYKWFLTPSRSESTTNHFKSYNVRDMLGYARLG
jgi:hypothetical protein